MSAADRSGAMRSSTSSYHVHTIWPPSHARHAIEMRYQPRRPTWPRQAAATAARAATTHSAMSVMTVAEWSSLPTSTGHTAKAPMATTSTTTTPRYVRQPSGACTGRRAAARTDREVSATSYCPAAAAMLPPYR